MGTRSAAVIGFFIGCVVAAGTATVYASHGPFFAALVFGASLAAISFVWYLTQHPRVARWLVTAVVIAAAGWLVWLTALPTDGRAIASGPWSLVLGESGRFLEALTTIRALLVAIAVLLLIIAQRLARIARSGRH